MSKQMFDVLKVAVTTTGSDGAATGSSETARAVNGKLYAVYIDYNASTPDTTDVTVALTEPPSATLLTVTSSKTDGWRLPREQVHGKDGVALTYDGTRAVAEAPPVAGNLTVSVAQANALTDCVVVYLFIERV